jgi:predicted nucleic acid-binding protein
MPVKIVDASALAALLFGEPEGPAVAKWLQDGELIAPALLGFEVANICVKKMSRHPERRESLLDAFAIFGRMSIEMVEVDHDETVRLAEQAGLTAYDASYLWLAQRHRGELVTLDKRLNRAAQTSRT